MTISKLPPVQFNFGKFWLEQFKVARNAPTIRGALGQISVRWDDIAEFKHDEHFGHDPEQAELELHLDMLTGRVMVRDLHWLTETFEGNDLVELSLAIAEYLYPMKKWEILEEEDWFAIVTDEERSLVFDMKNYQRLSAGASLLTVGDKKYQPKTEELEECNLFFEERHNRTLMALETAQRHLAEFSKDAVVKEFPKS